MLALCLLQCSSFKNYTNKKTKHLHLNENEILELNTVAYHNNDSSTDVFMQINNANLLYKRSDTANNFFAEVKVSYTLFEGEDLKKEIDSSSFVIIDDEPSEIVSLKQLPAQFNVPAMFGKSYMLKIETIDMNRRSLTYSSLKINKQDHLNNQNFLIALSDGLAYKSTFIKNQTVKIIPASFYIKKLTILGYTSETKPALPPFSKKSKDELPLKPDTSFQLDILNGQFVLHMPEKGFYFVKASNESDVGFCLYTYDAAFPGVSNVDEMIHCCRYIMYKEEFDSCRLAIDKKKAIDNFWLGLGGSSDRAHEILKKYYARVKEANQMYSSYLEGWKTDRGMISIIFGQPTNIYKSNKDEIWVYGIESNPSALRFIFNKEKNAFSDNNYVLERSEFYKDVYYQAVDYWRQGIVYSERGVDR